MYSTFIDSVIHVVDNFGSDILIDDRLWNILRDSYAFNLDKNLKDALKKSIDNGYVSEIAKYSGSKKNISTEILRILNKISSNNNKLYNEYVAVLFAIAIAKGLCKKNDYFDFASQINPGSTPTPNPSSHPNSKSKSKPNQRKSTKYSLTGREYLSLTLLVLFGCVVSFGGTIFYVTIFHDWWLFFIVLISGFLQLGYLSQLAEFSELGRRNNFSASSFNELVISISTPFVICVCCNAISSLLFFSGTFTRLLGEYFIGYGFDCSSSSIITFLLCCIYIVCIFAVSTLVFSAFNNFKDWMKWCRNNTLCIKSTVIILSLYIILFLSPIVTKSIKRYNIYRINSLNEQKYNAQIKRNNELQQSRNKDIELSFKGVKLGISYNTDVQSVEASKNFQYKYHSYYNLNIGDENQPIDFNTSIIPYDSLRARGLNDIGGMFFKAETLLDNIPVTLNVYEYRGIASMFIITPEYSVGSDNLSSFIQLYTKKYGEPEHRSISGKPSEPIMRDYDELSYRYYNNEDAYDTNNDDCVWTFKNGSIRISNQSIIYLTTQFSNDVNRIAYQRNVQKKMCDMQTADSLQQMKVRQQKIMHKKAYRDSIEKAKNHKNAIKEI